MNRILLYMAMAMTLLIWGCKGDNPQDGQPSLSIANITLEEANQNVAFTFTITLSEASNSDVTLVYRTEDGTATGGQDFETVNATDLTIPAGNTSATVEVQVIGDSDVEGLESFTLLLSSIEGARAAKSRATAAILDDDDEAIQDVGYRSADSYDGFTKVWEDDFSGMELDPETWSYELGDGCPDLCGWGNSELQTYTERPENAHIDNGFLVIEAREEQLNGSQFTSARIITQGKQSFQLGRIDIRAKMPEGQGMWPALWMLGESIQSVGWPSCGEIDIMEMVGGEDRESEVHGTVHWDNDGSYANFGGSYTLPSGTLADEFHVYSVIWEAEQIIWLIDDIQYHVIDTSPGTLSEFRAPHFFIFNIAVGGTWPGNPDNSTVFPQQMVVDYVRVFQEN